MLRKRDTKKNLFGKGKITKKEIEKFKKFSKAMWLDPEKEYFMYIRRMGRSRYKLGFVISAKQYLKSMRKAFGRE